MHGTVMLGPTSPVCVPAHDPCMGPARGAMLSFDLVDDGHTAGSALVAKDGTYSVTLPPGVYNVNWKYAGTRPRIVGGLGIDPSMVEVSPRENGRVDFTIDTGIR